LAKADSNKVLEQEAFDICKEKIANHNLEMKLVSVHYLLEEPKILFFFTAENRVDFRELVKDLVSVFKTRIELRQIGVRDESREIGGLGVCGRGYCCHAVSDK
jgi:cell fate regulator YaaT (PSP1 superfamily)